MSVSGLPPPRKPHGFSAAVALRVLSRAAMAPVLIALAALVAWPEEHVQRTASAEGLGSGEFWLPIEYSTLSGWRVADSEPLPPFEQMPDPPVVTDLFHSHRVVLRNASIQVLFRALGG